MEKVKSVQRPDGAWQTWGKSEGMAWLFVESWENQRSQKRVGKGRKCEMKVESMVADGDDTTADSLCEWKRSPSRQEWVQEGIGGGWKRRREGRLQVL